MKELFEKFLMHFCMAGLGMTAVAVLVRAALPAAAQKVREAAEAVRRSGVVAAIAVAVFVYGMIVYGSTKNNAQSNDSPAQMQMPVSPAVAGEARPSRVAGEIVLAGHEIGSDVVPFGLPQQTGSSPSVPSNALERVEKWWRRGALNDGHVVTFDEGWCFPYGTNHLTSIEVWSSGAVYATEKDPTPIAELVTKLSLAPRDTEVFVGMTTNSSYIVEWHGGHPNRDLNQTADASIELLRNGNVIVTEGGVSAEIPYAIPFSHDGFGQDEDWVRANFTNADEILSIGYPQWVDQQVGVELANGLYRFSAEFLVDPPEPTELYIGDYTVCVTNAGVYSFVLEKGTEYEFGTWPFNDDVDYWAQDDMAAEAPILRSMWGGWGSPGEWTIDGGWNWLALPYVYYGQHCNGYCSWLPTLQGSPNVGHLGVGSFPQSFEAILSDYCGSCAPSYQWSSSDASMEFATPNESTTTVTCASIPSWNMCTMSVQANLGCFSLWSYLYPTYGTNSIPQVHLSLDVPEGVALNGQRRMLSASFTSDIPTNGCVILRCINGADKISLWSSLTNGVSLATSNSWDVAVTNSFSCYIEGVAQSAYEDVKFECTYVPISGSNIVVCAMSTVFVCHAQPVSNITRTGLEVVNPSFLSPQSNAVFRVDVQPTEVPASKISWRTVAGTASFQSGTNGLETVVLGSSGMVDLEINVLGATDERMHFKSKVQ